MNRITQVRLAVAAAAVGVWGYGYSVDDRRITMAGIVLLAVSLLLRFLGPRRPRRSA